MEEGRRSEGMGETMETDSAPSPQPHRGVITEREVRRERRSKNHADRHADILDEQPLAVMIPQSSPIGAALEGP